MKTAQIESLIKNPESPVKANPKGDRCNVCILLILYTLQGVPLGVSLAIPVIMQSIHSSSFKEQAQFSLAIWPFSLKLLWAPLVDSLFIRKFGRRKSWLIPLQYLLGIVFFITGFYINDWLIDVSKPQILNLTIVIFLLNLLTATQDIVVDGWALTMLKKENISYSAMCNSAGQIFGIFLGNVLLILLLSEQFWNKWWRNAPLKYGIVSLQGYLYFWGAICIIITTLLALFKTEKYSLSEPDVKVGFGIIKTYKLLFRIIKLPHIKKFAIILLTVKLGFSIEAAFKLKLINGGISKDEIASYELFIIPLRISLPFFVTKFSSKEKPLKIFFNTIPYRLVVGVVYSIVIFYTPKFVTQKGSVLYVYKVILVLIYSIQQLVMNIMLLTIMAFYAIISDPKIGGTNMTLLTTIANIGNIWSSSAALWLIDFLTLKQCSVDTTNKCSSQKDQNVCKSFHGNCEVSIDGFYIETLICTVYGVLWYFIFRKSINKLQSKNVKEWHIEMKSREI